MVTLYEREFNATKSKLEAHDALAAQLAASEAQREQLLADILEVKQRFAESTLAMSRQLVGQRNQMRKQQSALASRDNSAAASSEADDDDVIDEVRSGSGGPSIARLDINEVQKFEDDF